MMCMTGGWRGLRLGCKAFSACHWRFASALVPFVGVCDVSKVTAKQSGEVDLAASFYCSRMALSVSTVPSEEHNFRQLHSRKRLGRFDLQVTAEEHWQDASGTRNTLGLST